MPAKILVVDDNEDILFMLKAMLELKNYHVELRSHPRELNDFILQFNPDILIMDMLLSGADGREVCRLLRANAAHSNLHIIMVSAHSHARQSCMDAGANHFLEKPFDIDDIYLSLERGMAV